MYKFKTIIIDICRSIVDKLELGIEDKKWELLRFELFKEFTEDEMSWVTAIIDNQINWCRMEENSAADSYEGRAARARRHGVMVRATAVMCKELRPLQDIIGIQPMNGPVSLAYLMKYGYAPVLDDDGNKLPQPADEAQRKIQLSIETKTVVAQSRKLQLRWSPELAQDLAQQPIGLDIESEIIQAIGHELAYEIISEVIQKLRYLSAENRTFELSTMHDIEAREDGSNHVLHIEINKLANNVARLTRRGAGNFIIASPQAIALLQSSAASVFAPHRAAHSTLLEQVGTLNGSIRVFCMKYGTIPMAESDDVLIVGYKGYGATDTGYVYSPYVPLISTGPALNPTTFVQEHRFMTRYGYTVFDPEGDSLSSSGNYYSTLTFKNTPPVDQAAQTA